jgi:hypothetical protein
MAYKMIEFRADGSPCVVGFAESGSVNVIGLTIEPVKGEGLCFVRASDDIARAAWNRPIVTPQVPTRAWSSNPILMDANLTHRRNQREG